MTLSLSSHPTPAESRSWSVKPEYRTKTDAKIAVVCAAGAEAVEFVRFKGQPAPPGHDPFKPYKRSGAVDQKTAGSKQSTASGQVKLGRPSLENKEQAISRKKSSANWDRSVSRAQRYQSVHGRSAPRSVSLNYGAENSRKGPFPSAPSRSAASSARTTPAHRAHFNQSQRNHNSGPYQQQEYSKEAIAKLRPPRKSQQLQQRTQQASSSHQLSTTNPQATQQETKPPESHQPIPSQLVPPQPPPPPPPPQQILPYGAGPQPQQPQTPPFQHPLYPPTMYPGPYGQSQYSYPVPQGTPYPPPASGYSYSMAQVPPTAPPAYGTPAYSYPAYYPDPRYAQYPQYSMPGAPMPYAVSMPPAPGMQYPTPPMPPTAPAPTTPVISTQANTSLPTPPTSSSTERPASAQWIEIERSSIRTASYRMEERDREKRPRSRDTSPEDAQLHKKHRPESSKEQTSVKREPINSPPVPSAPPTPVSAPSKDSTSHVQQLISKY